MRDIASICHERGVLIHTDAAQSVGKVRTKVDELDVDLLSLAGHKLYAPKGIGVLFVRQNVDIEPVMHGAGHEKGLRPGTENVPHIVGLGAAALLAAKELEAQGERLARLRDRLCDTLRQAIGERLVVHGEQAARLPNTLSVNFPQVLGSEIAGPHPGNLRFHRRCLPQQRHIDFRHAPGHGAQPGRGSRHGPPEPWMAHNRRRCRPSGQPAHRGVGIPGVNPPHPRRQRQRMCWRCCSAWVLAMASSARWMYSAFCVPGESPLIGHAHGREIEGLFRLQLTGTPPVLHRFCVASDSAVEHRQCQVGQDVIGILAQQLLQFRNRLLVLAVIFELVGLVVQRCQIGHGLLAPWYVGDEKSLARKSLVGH